MDREQIKRVVLLAMRNRGPLDPIAEEDFAGRLANSLMAECNWNAAVSAGIDPSRNCLECNGPIEEGEPDVCKRCFWEKTALQRREWIFNAVSAIEQLFTNIGDLRQVNTPNRIQDISVDTLDHWTNTLIGIRDSLVGSRHPRPAQRQPVFEDVLAVQVQEELRSRGITEDPVEHNGSSPPTIWQRVEDPRGDSDWRNIRGDIWVPTIVDDPIYGADTHYYVNEEGRWCRLWDIPTDGLQYLYHHCLVLLAERIRPGTSRMANGLRGIGEMVRQIGDAFVDANERIREMGQTMAHTIDEHLLTGSDHERITNGENVFDVLNERIAEFLPNIPERTNDPAQLARAYELLEQHAPIQETLEQAGQIIDHQQEIIGHLQETTDREPLLIAETVVDNGTDEQLTRQRKIFYGPEEPGNPVEGDLWICEGDFVVVKVYMRRGNRIHTTRPPRWARLNLLDDEDRERVFVTNG